MKKILLKYTFPLIVLILSLVLIVISIFWSLEQKKEKELNYQKFLVQQQAQRETEKIYLMGKFDPSQREDFTLIPLKNTTNNTKMYLRKETLNAFLNMAKTAQKDGINLKIASATRNFDYQRDLWNNKWSGFTLVNGKKLNINVLDDLERFKKILEYSSVPGTSRHHWGSDIDFNASTPEYFKTAQGEEEYEWLIKNAPLFGFCQPYTLKGTSRPTGYNEEKWHWSYLPLAKTFTEEYKNLITKKDIIGFLGDKYVEGQNLINDYVFGINPECL